jgi:GNAT superfamily N-acetyltransferase
MLWRVRTTLADRPGSLAVLARRCGERSVNILGLQIFPGVEGVTDELVLRSPAGWSLADVAGLVESAGGTRVSVGACTERALVDGPTRFLHALRAVVHGVSSTEQALAGLLDAEVAEGADRANLTPVQDRLDVSVAGRRLDLRRADPFTATEHARATAFAEALDDLHARGLLVSEADRTAEQDGPDAVTGGAAVREASYADAGAVMAMHDRCSHDTIVRHYGAPLARLDLRLARRMLVGENTAVVAEVGGALVGFATLSPVDDGRAELSILVEDGWQRRGIGTRLLGAATRRAAEDGAEHVVMRGPADSPAAIALVFGSGLRARARLSGDELVMTVATRGLAAAPSHGAGTGAAVTPLRPAPA